MNLHQVLTGAVNPGDYCFSVGSLHDQPFTAYASGCDIVVLGTDFERLQIIPGAKHGNIQVGCVDCSMQQGKIAASYGEVICIFEPVSLVKQNSGHCNTLHYQWQKNAQISVDAIAHNLTWDPTETLLPNDSLLNGGGYNNWSEAASFTNNFKRNTSSKEKVQNALELNLRHFRRGRRRTGAVVAHAGYAPHQRDAHEVHRNILPHANALCHFHIAASINPATDIPLLPSITSLSLGENEETSGPFVVHWLNNKELHFTLSMEVFLQQLKKSFEHHSRESNTEESNQMDGRSDEEVNENGDEQKRNHEKKDLGDEKTTANSSFVPLSSAIIDHEIEILLSEWSKNADMLFSIHPMDGSLLVWHVDWLDEYQPGMFRQVQVSFVSRIPVAFPTGDANSLCRSIVMYACTKNVDLAIQQGKQKPPGLTRSSSMLISSGHSKSTNSLKLSIFTPNVMMISKHADGSLNQWLVSFAEESAFSTVLSISHKSRYCGHRFHLNDLACHSVLPLLLTTSHHNALISPNIENAKQANDSLKSQESPLRFQSRGNANVTSQDPNAVYSELILWRVDPVGPLSFSGGVSELARINSLHVSAFSNVAWLPTLIPSYCLGAYCNSPSACFVASDGQHLRLYQAVIDAKKLLCELSSPEISHGRKTQLFHVFREDFILSNQEKESPEKKTNSSDSGNQQNGFSEKFYLIVVEYTQNCSLLHMWHLHLKSIPVSVGHLSSSSIYPVCRAPYLLATSCSDGKVRFWRCRVTTELSASSVPECSGQSDVTYVWEEWPLLIEDGLLSSSAINVPGRPTEVSCAHTNRLAVAYKQVTSKNSNLSQDFVMHVSIFECESTGGSSWVLEQTLHLDEIGTMLDSGVSVDSNLVAYNRQDISLSHGGNIMPSTKHLVHLDWMSREDGSHILTVGIGSKLYMFGQLSGRMQEQNGKEIVAFSHSGSMKATTLSGFVLLRCVDLVSSVEGSPPFPVSLSWVRDGILVVGMDCEMHVYSQWQSPSKQELVSTDSYSGSMPSITGLMKQSLSAVSGLHPPKRTLTRSMASLAQKLSGKRSAYGLSAEMEDSGLFEAAHALSPTLPQYHPYQLLELMDLGKVRRTKAILSHLVKCIAGEVVAINESEPNHNKRLRSLTISAGGSTARDPKTFSKTEATDYIEIDSVPPLPLYALLAADEDSSHSCSEKSNNQNKKEKPSDNYEGLFQNTAISTDELVIFDADEDSSKPKVIDLSQYSPTYFGPEHAQVLSRHLLHSSLPGLTRMEQMSLMALADTIATTSTEIGESRDRNQGLSTSHFAWAFHSVAEEELLSMLPAMQKGDPAWSELRAMGVGWWVRNIHSLRKCIEKVAKAAFQRNNDPLDAAIFYLAMKKKAVIWGLYRSQKDTKMTQFFGNNFTEDRWRKAALKNAFSLLGKQRFEHSAAFFLLAGHLKDAVEVCLEKLNDIQLALVISRLYESEFEVSSTYKSVLQKRILGSMCPGKESLGNMHCDPFLRSMAYWILEDYSKALDTLIKHSVEDKGGEGDSSSSCNPAVFNFYNYLRTHPLLLRRHFGSSDTSSTHICLTVENGLADKINVGERRLFFTTAYAHLKAGCPMLALEVLSKMPKVIMRSKSFCRSPSLMDTSKDFSPSSPVKELETKDKSSSVDWSQPVLNGLGSSSDCSSGKQSSSTLSFDWSQPSVVFQDEPLKLQSDSDGSESEDSSLVMKELKPLKKTEKIYEASSSYTESFSVVDDTDILSQSEDIISAQLKFRACLKILTVELRTLSTGYEIDGGKLRYQLYQWLEREVVALQKTCDYSVEDTHLEICVMPEEATLQENTEDLADQQKRVLQKEDFQRRRQWLLKYQSLLRMFLSYCILHGSHGGGLASVRMELILLLQESQQEQSMQIPSSPLPEQSSIPLLFACTASAKTVVANPLLHLGNLTHDILHAIVNLDSPPHPDTQNNKIYVMHTLAASLSACIYQCLCDGHSYSSFQANQFTGTVYQTVLLTQRHSLRAASLEETVTPNTSPAEWPDDGEKQQKHYRLSSKTSPKDSSQLPALPLVDQESPFYRERYIPPELSIWDYFIAKPFLPSQSRVEYDSEESQESGEDDEDIDGDVFASNSHNQEHSNSNSYRSSGHVALSVKRLWQYLVKQEEIQETFIRNIFTKKRCLNESLEEHNETMKNSVVEEPIINKVETDMGYPGGKARIIHKESDIITAFAVNKANRNCIAIASSHDIQELDVSAILATQIYTWVDDDVEIENKGADDFLVIHARDDLVNVQGTTPYTHSNPGTPINMPWLGSTQTGRGASVMLKKAINNVRRMASHPTLPYYLTGAQDGSVRMFEWGHAQQITCFRSGGNSRVTRMRFNYQGNKTWQCHNKTANDFVFISSSSLIATAGSSSDNRNICLWDTLVSPTNSLVHAFICHDSGATVLAYAPKHQLLISGGRKGFTCIIDLRQKQQQQLLQSHDSPVKAIAVDPTEEYFVTGSAEGNIKVWSLSTFNLLHTFVNEHSRQSLFRNIGTGVMQIETGPANHIFSCGADGTVKMRILPDRLSPFNDVLKNDVKFMM
ncbi:hypothetical protein AAES_123971 [Amazona aestiva]|uniref:RAVE complex protein Rav1 C-terminal domain-containing protein n=1 Tax=Amazona aestiva TaxID=12930 RepID=A0A0Q3QWX3_AMAAE|nr:hypothetical protein AAES_123971 [Amazona aestiva]